MAGCRLRRPVLRLPLISRAGVAAAGLVLATSFLAQLLLLEYQVDHDGSHPDWVAHTPLLLVYPVLPLGPAHWAFSLAALALSLAQSAALALFAAALAQRGESEGGPSAARLARRLTPYLAAYFALLALWSPAVSSADVFGYVGLGMLGPHPFTRPAHFFTGEYARVFAGWTLRPTIYGPLWTTLNAGLVALGTSFAGKVMVLRVAGVVLLALLAALVRVVGRSRALTAAVLLNPMLWFQFVSNAHNDLVAVCLLAGAIALVVRRYHPLAALLVAAAGLVKFPFMIVGAVVFERLGPRRALLYAAGAAGLCVLLSALFGGRPYLDALLDTGRLTDAATAPLMKYAKVTIALSTLGIVAFVVFRRRFPSFGGFVFPAIAPTFYPWYLLWALPYALAARRFALPTLVALPLLGTLADGIYGYHGFSLLVPAAALGWVVWSAAPGARGSTPSGSNAVL